MPLHDIQNRLIIVVLYNNSILLPFDVAETVWWVANSDPDPMPRSVASHRGLHHLLRSICLNIKMKYSIIIRPAHDKTYNKTCVTRKDSDQPIRPPSMARVLVYPSLEAVEGTCDQRRLWSDCADAQADLSRRWSNKSPCRICRALAHIE